MVSPGDIIGPYIIVEKKGGGQFGEVWLAEKRTEIVTTQFAIKIAKNFVMDLKEIKKEANSWVKASGHPNVTPIIEADVYNGQVVIVSEYISDGSLSDWLNNYNGRAPYTDIALEIINGILAGLKHLHSRKIIHRDLKPANILLQEEVPRIADFGLACILETSLELSKERGTPLYMAPEAFEGHRSEQTDIWSVGVILYQLIKGELPFSSKDYYSLVFNVATKDPEPLPSSVPDNIQTIILKALEKDPEKRYKTASSMQTDIKKALKSRRSNTMLLDAVEFADNPEPRCPCVLLVDTSGSMVGDPINSLNAGLNTFKESLIKDKIASKRVEVAIVEFNDKVRILQNFVTPDKFEPPTLKTEGYTHMAEGIQEALNLIQERKRQYIL